MFTPLPEAAYFLALQRTQYICPVQFIFRHARLGRLYDKYLLRLEAKLRSRAMFDAYYSEMLAEMNKIRDFLPVKADRILDIGCGIAGIDVLLNQHYQGSANITLLDKNGVSDIFYGFKKQAAFYNSLPLAQKFLTQNGVSQSQLTLRDVDKEGYPTTQKFDVILSLISWCFHYPAEVYAQQVRDSLAEGGVLIVDVRKDTGGKEHLQAVLGITPRIITEAAKYERLFFQQSV